MMMQRRVSFAWSAVLMLSIGCAGGDKPPVVAETVAFEGVVKADGKPLSGATVSFLPKAAAGFHGASGVTDENGKYVLESDIGNNKTKKGVIPGSYNVTVSRLVKPDGTVIKFDPLVPPMNVGAKEQIPMKYSQVNDMGLFTDVPASGGKFDIEISLSE